MDFDQPPDAVYLVLSGAFDVAIKQFIEPAVVVMSAEGENDVSKAPGAAAGRPRDPHERHFASGPGSVLGATDFVLRRPRSFRAVAVARSGVVAVDRAGYRRMAAAAPQAAAFLQVSGSSGRPAEGSCCLAFNAGSRQRLG
jgi:hypothetical protein